MELLEFSRSLKLERDRCERNSCPLPFDMSVAPRVFSKLKRFVMEPLRIQGIRTVYYLDDICLLARTKDEMYKNVQTTLTHLNKLGFIINYSKSKLIPEKVQDFLGFQFNRKTMTISVPTTKMEKLTSRVKQLLKSPTEKSCRWLASLIGKITAMIPAMGDALLHVRLLQRDLARSLC